MTFDEMKQVVREQKAGHEWLAQIDLEGARRATFEDRVRSFNNIMGLARALHLEEPDREDDDQVTLRWTRIRRLYAAAHG